MKWVLEEYEECFDKYFFFFDLDIEEGCKVEEMLEEFFVIWEFDIEKMEMFEFLISLMYIFNEDLELIY